MSSRPSMADIVKAYPANTDQRPKVSNPSWVRQAIETRYAGPTDHRGSRIIVKSEAGRMTVPWDHALDVAANHAAAAEAFIYSRGWSAWRGTWSMGGTAKGYVFTFLPVPDVEDL